MNVEQIEEALGKAKYNQKPCSFSKERIKELIEVKSLVYSNIPVPNNDLKQLIEYLSEQVDITRHAYQQRMLSIANIAVAFMDPD